MTDSNAVKLDDFTHLSMESSATSLSSLNSRSQYSQVIFQDLAEVYPTDSDIRCRYTFQSGVSPQSGDRVALYKVGWTSVAQFSTYIMAESPEPELLLTKRFYNITFPVESLPKDEVDLYQLCYVTSGNIIAGASMPFSFRRPHESELVAIEDPLDPGLVVFRSRATQLQDQLALIQAEKENMERKLFETSRNLEKVVQDTETFIDTIEVQKKVIHQLEADHSNLQQQMETERTVLEEKLSEAGKELEESERARVNFQEEYIAKLLLIDSLEQKIKDSELNSEIVKDKKEQVANMEKMLEQMRVNVLRTEQENSELKAENASMENKIASLEATIDLLTQEHVNCEALSKSLQCNNQELTRRSEQQASQLEQMKAQLSSISHKDATIARLENELALKETKLIEMSEKHNQAVAENQVLRGEVDALKEKVTELEENNNSMEELVRQTLTSGDPKVIQDLEDENALLETQLRTLTEVHNTCEQQCNERLTSLERELTARHRQLVDRLTARPAPPPASGSSSKPSSPPLSFFSLIDPTKWMFDAAHARGDKQPGGHQQAGGQKQPGGPKQASEEKENVDSVERQAKIRQLMAEKADIRNELVQSRHRNEELQSCVDDMLEEGAALKSRIKVLEIELKRCKRGGPEEAGEVTKLKEENGLLVKNVEELMRHNSRMYQQVEELRRAGSREGVDEVKQRAARDRLLLEAQIVELKKELVGKVSLAGSTVQAGHLQERSGTMEEGSGVRACGCSVPSHLMSEPVECPVCGILFPPQSAQLAIKHFQDHLD